ncbi:MAG: hypothetical protein ABMA26_00230 [Limisphaerales bacterium]
MRKSARSSAPHPVRNLASIFVARRDLLRPIRDSVLAGCDLPLEQADILVELHGVRHLGWTEPESSGDGFVRFQTLLDCLVHEVGMFSRRIAALEQAGLLETRKACQVPELATAGLHRSTQVARITPAGKRKIAPVWSRYMKLAERLLAKVPAAKLEVHYEVNQLIRAEIKLERLASAGDAQPR